MAEVFEKKKKFDGEEVEVLGANYVEGIPEGPDKWRKIITDREEMLKYVKISQRYFYGVSFGSEKRKTPA